MLTEEATEKLIAQAVDAQDYLERHLAAIERISDLRVGRYTIANDYRRMIDLIARLSGALAEGTPGADRHQDPYDLGQD